MMLECTYVAAPLGQILRGYPFTASLATAHMFGRRRDNVLKKIVSLGLDHSRDLIRVKAIVRAIERIKGQPMIQRTKLAARDVFEARRPPSYSRLLAETQPTG